MSIIAAVTAGLVAGAVGSNWVFNYSKNVYLEKISELEALVIRLEAHLANMENLKSQIPTFWNDDNAAEMMEALNKTISKTRTNTNLAKNLLENFKNTVEEMDTSKSKLSEAMDAAQAILGALKA